MAINKNFVITNGLEVSNDLIYADSDTRRVGINSEIPDFELDVDGDVSFTGALSVGGTTGTVGAYLESTGDGVQWKALPTLRVVERYTATEGQTIFPSVGFFPFESAEFIDVFVDGVKLAQDEYNTLVGNNRIELLAAAIAGETIELVAYNASTVAAGYTGIQGLTVAEEGVVVGLSDGVKLLNFVGAYVTAIGSGAGVTVFLDDRLAQDTNYWLSNASGLSTTTNVGVKNSSPTRTLDVTGTARVTSGLEAGTFYSASGVSTFSNVIIGSATTELVVNGSARITGILTIGTASITLDGSKNEIKIGTAVTLNQSGNAYLTGIVTAQSFNGNGANVSNVDAVSLAGLSSDSFLRADANDSFTGTLSGSGSLNITGVATASRISASTGTVTTLTGTSFNYTGVNTATTLFSTTANATTAYVVTGIVTNLSGTNASYSGIGTFGSLNIGATQIVSSGRQLQNIASLDATTTATIESAVSNAPNTFTDLNVSGVSTFAGITTVTGQTLFAKQLNVSGVVTASSFSGNLANTLTLNTSGTGLSGSTTFNNSGSSTFTVTSNATSDNTSSAIVSRNSAGGFSAGIITATLDGNATSATYATSSGIATYSTSSGIATYATSAGISTSVIGGVGSITQLSVSGISTLSTLNVGTGGTVVTITPEGNVGIGSTIPVSKLTVRDGDISVGISTAHGVILTSPNGTQYRLIVDNSGNLSTTAV